MLNNFRNGMCGVLGLGVGAFLAVILILLLPFFPLSTESPVYKTLGINKHRIIGFLPYWLLAKANKEYAPYLTTLTYFGLTIDTDGHIQKLVTPQEEEPGWTTLKISKILQQKLQDAKNNQEVLSLLVQQADEASISALLENPKKSADNLVSDVIPIMQKYEFSDLNVDIESFENADTKKQQAFKTFLTELRNQILAHNLGTLTVDITPSAFVKHYLLVPQVIGTLADYVIVMGYDYHYSGSFVAGPVAPLYGAGVDSEFDVSTAIDIAKKEIPSNKLILGIPLYGYEWATVSDSPGSPVIPDSAETASNNRISTELKNCPDCQQSNNTNAEESAIVYLDKQEPYYHQIFVFNNDAMAKRLVYAKNAKLEGIALWALGYEGNTLLDPVKDYKFSINF